MERVELLRLVPMFEGLGEDDLNELAGRLVTQRFGAGDVVLRKGETGDEMYIVADGHLNIHLPDAYSRKIHLRDIGPGEYFGELALLDRKPRSASVEATSEVELLALSRETFASYLERRPRAVMPILQTIVQRLRDADALLLQRAARNAFREVEENLSWGDKLADKVAELNGSWSFIIGLLLLTVTWTAANLRGVLGRPFDEYPYVFYNLVLAILVALQGPLIVMSQNRSALKERAQAETDFRVNLKNEVNIETLVREVRELRAELDRRLQALEHSTQG